MRVVTTCHKQGFEDYGHRLLSSFHKWPAAELYWYTERYELPPTIDLEQPSHPVVSKSVADLTAFQEWKLKHAAYIAPSWQWDVVRFAHKVFAIAGALYDYTGIGVWIDADCVIHEDVPAGLIQSYVKDDYVACFQRTGMHTETGMIVFDCGHEKHQAFMDAWREWYHSENFKRLPMWTDCHTFDMTIRRTGVTANNLSGEFAKTMHPMARAEIAKYVDHCKGARKVAGRSKENVYRAV
jgi:hypothetical protein